MQWSFSVVLNRPCMRRVVYLELAGIDERVAGQWDLSERGVGLDKSVNDLGFVLRGMNLGSSIPVAKVVGADIDCVPMIPPRPPLPRIPPRSPPRPPRPRGTDLGEVSGS